MAAREESPEYFDAVDWMSQAETKMTELKKKECSLARKEKELKGMKKLLEEEIRCHEKSKERSYRIERELNQLKRKVLQWESEEEQRKCLKRRRERQMREDAEIRKKVRIEEEERERVRREFVNKRKKRTKHST